MTSISLIIPTFNNASTIRDCLDSISRQTLSPDAVIVVDGHSTDDTVEIAKQFECQIYYEDGGSRAAACNVGIAHSTGDIIAFIDADAIAKILHEHLPDKTKS